MKQSTQATLKLSVPPARADYHPVTNERRRQILRHYLLLKSAVAAGFKSADAAFRDRGEWRDDHEARFGQLTLDELEVAVAADRA